MIEYNLKPGQERKIRQNYKDYSVVISVITPSWNAEKYIFELANCILNQTYPYFEWLIIDDGSTNKESLQYYDEIEKMDSRIKVFHKKNEGLSLTRDYGVEKTNKNSEYVVFIDDDDLLDPTFLECAYYTMAVNSNSSWCYSDTLNFQAQEFPWCKHFSSEAMKHENLLVSQAMVRKKDYYEVGGFNIPGNGFYEDWFFWLKLLAKKKFPIHMGYFGFWYRKKENAGQLKLAVSNHQRNLKIIEEYSKEVKEEVKAIEFPRENYTWSILKEQYDNIIVPNYCKDDKKTILFILPWMIMGGADKFNLDLITRLNKEKYRIIIISTIPTEYVYRQHFESVADEVFDLSSFLDRKDWLSFINYIIDSRKVDLVFNTNSQYGYAVLPYIKSKYPSLPIMDYIHMEEWYNRGGGYSRDSSAVGSVITRTLFCNKNSEEILKDYFKSNVESTGTVYIGVDSDKFDSSKFNKKELQKKYNIPENKIIVSLIARIDYQKRPFLLMEIVKACQKADSDFFFVVVGNGQLLEKIMNIAKKEHLNNVMFLGQIDTPSEIYAVSDITLNCSIKEGLALTSYESLSMGVPVVSANVGGQKELIDDSVGVIVDCLQNEEDIYDFDYSKEEINSYVNALIKVKNDLDSYKKNCRKRILNKFSLDKMAINMEENIDDVISNYKKDNTLKNHTDIAIELVNLFLIVNSDDYQWSVFEYNKKIYNYIRPIEKKPANSTFLYKCRKLSIKMHLYRESLLTLQYCKQIYNYLKNLVKSVFMIPYLIIKYIVTLIVMLFNRIINLIKKI